MMKVYTENVYCINCPHRYPMGQWKKRAWDPEFYNRFLCLNEKDPKEIILHPSLDAPDWCKLPDVIE